jgi:hypothetical protein
MGGWVGGLVGLNGVFVFIQATVSALAAASAVESWLVPMIL